MIQPRYFWWNYFLNNFSLLVQSSLFVDVRHIPSYFIMIIDKQNVARYRFSGNTCSSTTHGEVYFEHLCFFYLSISWNFCHLLANLFPSFWLFCVLLWIRWMQVTVHKLCHLPHASRITTCGTISAEIFFGVSKKWVRSWSHTFLITNVKKLTRKLLAVSQEKGTRRKKN